jgi:peptide/nickel transport system substrate-binding protein
LGYFRRSSFVGIVLVAICAAANDTLVVSGLNGRTGGVLVYGQRNEAKTLNPAIAADNASREVIYRLHADLIHINRYTQKTEPALAKSWTVSADGRHYTVDLRRGVKFSNGQPFDADDVVFSFRVYLDEKVHSPQRDLLVMDGRPITVEKLDEDRVRFDLPKPYAAAERLFDSFAILPRHLLEPAWREGKLAASWGLRTPAPQMAGLGPFRFVQCTPGERVVLERNPYYWKSDAAGRMLPYIDRLEFSLAGTEDVQVMRFEAGESDIVSRIGAKNFAALEQERPHHAYMLKDAGPGLEYSFVFFNLNDAAPPAVRARQAFFKLTAFRRALSLAIDRAAVVKLVYLGHAVPLAVPVPPGNKAWIDESIPAPVRSVEKARELLRNSRFTWSRDGTLLSPEGVRVEFTIATSAGNSDRAQMAALVQDDLKQLGIDVHVAPLEFRSLLDRVQRTHDYEACLLSLVEADADPNSDMEVWLSSGGNHLWNPEQKTPATPWEAEIDSLMRRQIGVRAYGERKRLFDRVQQLLAENLPLIPLVTPDVLAGAREGLENFQAALLDPYTLWNVEQLYWRGPGGRPARRPRMGGRLVGTTQGAQP